MCNLLTGKVDDIYPVANKSRKIHKTTKAIQESCYGSVNNKESVTTKVLNR